ncbi:MAG: hypothetical protein M1832_003150 [Thelocarpon impressellum]|nr:MAG: hypothetical protein M1832_003150 [Thelocarpon impressellum]
MSPASESIDWDFASARKFISSFPSASPKTAGKTPKVKDDDGPSTSVPTAEEDGEPCLGNFDKLWEELDKLGDVPPIGYPVVATKAGLDEPPECQTVELDTPLKGVRWRDEDGLAGLEDSSPGSNIKVLPRPPSPRRYITRSYVQKQKKAAKRVLENNHVKASLASDFESETDLQSLRASPTPKHVQQRDRPGQALNDGSDGTWPSSTSPPKPSILKPGLHEHTSNTALWRPPTTQVEPLLRLSSAERKAKLLGKLLEAYPLETRYLLDPARAIAVSGPTHDGIHVFVDSSNITIGFFETLKRARGIPESARPKRAPMSFHSLAMVLERGRPAGKRVLVGSKPRTAEMEEAEACGYKTSVLDRVRKAREPTPTKRRYHKSGNATSGPSSGSESAGPQKLVEQAVDEVLHLKMLESIVDADEPATMVLASGDAAEAEYSEGFMKMVDRALRKGWNVELVSFRQNISYAYRKKEFREKWKGQFKIIELDPYGEELLDL